MDEIMLDALRVIIMSICLVVARYLIPFIKQKTMGTKYQTFMEWTVTAVQWAEQTIHGTGQEKKEAVIEFLLKLSNESGMGFTYEQIDSLIESAVWALKEGKDADK